jgi:very-short-patch-repair endonuclease
MADLNLIHSHDHAALLAFFDEVCESPIEKSFAHAFTDHSRVYTSRQKEIPDDFFSMKREYYRESVLLIPQLKVNRYRLDFAVLFTAMGSLQKWAIECDGQLWHSSTEQVSKDLKRDAYLKNYGWRTLRFTGGALHYRGEEIADRVHLEINALKGGVPEADLQEHFAPEQFEEVGETDAARWYRRTQPHTQ